MPRGIHRNRKHAIIKREESKCQMCGKSLEYQECELHHIIPLSMDKSLMDSLDNMMLLCNECHRAIHCNPFLNVSVIVKYFPEKIELLKTFTQQMSVNVKV